LITPDDDEAVRFFGGGKSGRPAYSAHLTRREHSIIDHVWRKYGALGGTRLSNLTHQPGTPWFATYRAGRGRNEPIDNLLIKEHYDEIARRAAQNARATAR
jgi:hypothetical protein